MSVCCERLWLTVLVVSVSSVAASDNSACDNNDDDEEVAQWVADGGFFLLLLGVCAMFWGLAAVCEEYFVPALNILCEELNVPDDVAGATFMAAGASSPEMFTSFIALFVDHSTLGVGTVVGSEIFNHMVICAGSVMFSTTGVLYLDKYIFTRDVAAYFLSLVILIWALKGSPIDAVKNMFSSGVENECLNVTIYHATGLLVLYITYAIVSGNFQGMLKKFNLVHINAPPDEETDDLRQSLLDMSPIPEGGDDDDEKEDDSILNVLTSAVEGSSPTKNYRKGQVAQSVNLPATSYSYRSHRAARGQSLRVKSSTMQSLSHNENRSLKRSSFVKDQALYSWRSSNLRQCGEDIESGDTLTRRSKAGVIGPATSGWHGCLRMIGSEANQDELGTMEISTDTLSGYLFLKSNFFNMECCSVIKTWRLRYFTIDRYGLHSRRYRQSAMKGPQIEMIDLHTCCDVEVIDRSQGLFVVHRSSSSNERPYVFASTSLELLDEVVSRLKILIQESQGRSHDQELQFKRKASIALDGEYHLGDEGENHCGLLDPPDVEFGSPQGMLSTSWHYLILPLKFVLHHTLPDVMLKGGRKKYIRCLFVSVIWLALLSYIMIKCCDGLGEWIGTSPIVMGLTLSAVGTSFPNLWSSMLVARQGLGNMAVSNAFGSNTFNICIALGLPWFTLVLISGEPYDKMRDDGIVFMVALLTLILITFYILVMLNSWRIKYWMSYYFVAVYIGVMTYAILHG